MATLVLAMAAPLVAGAVHAAPAASAPFSPANAPSSRAAVPPSTAPETRLVLQPCRLKGLAHEARCGVLRRPLDPGQPHGQSIALHVAVLPALARQKKPDAVFYFAGGPGQSAIALAGTIAQQVARLSNRRDVVLIDQRGTGRSAPLLCPVDPPTQPLAAQVDPSLQRQRLAQCLAQLQTLPHGDLRQYSTAIASADADAVRVALGLDAVNLVGVSYGTRAALDYLRQFPQSVRRVVLDGVAPPDMGLVHSFSPDAQAALDGLLAACRAEPTCGARHPRLQAQWAALLASLPRRFVVPHPLTGQTEDLLLTRDMLTSLVRGPLYLPALAAGLPQAIADASEGRLAGLAGLASALGGSADADQRLAMGMHFSVLCSEDLKPAGAAAGVAGAARSNPPPVNLAPGADFGSHIADLYQQVCAAWPRAAVPADFYRMPESKSPVLLLSGGLDPVTPPRHGQRATQALGAMARHAVVPNAGHGVMAIGCLRDAVYRFVDAESSALALEQAAKAADCAASVPRPGVFVPPHAAPADSAPAPAPAPAPEVKR